MPIMPIFGGGSPNFWRPRDKESSIEIIQCKDDDDCKDDNPCIINECIKKKCVNRPISGCATCALCICLPAPCENTVAPSCQGACPTGESCIDNGISCICANCSLRRVFVTSVDYTGDLGSVSCADAKCQELASAAGLSGSYLAWISNAPSPGSDGLSPANNPFWDRSSCRPFYLVDGTTLIANNWADLTDGTLFHPISKDEFGNCVTGGIVWTNTALDGTAAVLSGSCHNRWTSRSLNNEGQVGLIIATDSTWSSFDGLICNNLARLYCFEQ